MLMVETRAGEINDDEAAKDRVEGKV